MGRIGVPVSPPWLAMAVKGLRRTQLMTVGRVRQEGQRGSRGDSGVARRNLERHGEV